MSVECINLEMHTNERGDFKCKIIYSSEHFEGLTEREKNLEIFEECISVAAANGCALNTYIMIDKNTVKIIGIKFNTMRKL